MMFSPHRALLLQANGACDSDVFSLNSPPQVAGITYIVKRQRWFQGDPILKRALRIE